MKRRSFLLAPAALALADEKKRKLLLPSDKVDRFGFRIMWQNPIPPVDTERWRLRIMGMVEQPLEFTLAQLRAMPQVQQSSRMKCVQCWSSRATWGGFHLHAMLDAVKPKKPAIAIRIDCADKWFEYLTLKELANPRVLFALDMAGEPLSDDHGAPLRIIDPSKYGYKSGKLITSITFVDETKAGLACDNGPLYSASGEILPGYDTPLDLGGEERRKIKGGEITEY